MGATTKIDWADATWNPVTGCFHRCEYCYARRIARRFAVEGAVRPNEDIAYAKGFGGHIHDLREPAKIKGRNTPYPCDFEPTFHRYKLDEMQKWNKPRTIFVCSMADLFGAWIPDEWITEVFNACCAAPQHRYLFLTKAPKRYEELALKNKLLPIKNFWYGTSTPRFKDFAFWSRPPYPGGSYYHSFVSIEPILERFGSGGRRGTIALTDWTIIGAETGNRKGKVIPEKGWVMEIAEECKKYGKPIFMKESLREIMGDDFLQEFPWEAQT